MSPSSHNLTRIGEWYGQFSLSMLPRLCDAGLLHEAEIQTYMLRNTALRSEAGVRDTLLKTPKGAFAMKVQTIAALLLLLQQPATSIQQQQPVPKSSIEGS